MRRRGAGLWKALLVVALLAVLALLGTLREGEPEGGMRRIECRTDTECSCVEDCLEPARPAGVMV